MSGDRRVSNGCGDSPSTAVGSTHNGALVCSLFVRAVSSLVWDVCVVVSSAPHCRCASQMVQRTSYKVVGHAHTVTLDGHAHAVRSCCPAFVTVDGSPRHDYGILGRRPKPKAAARSHRHRPAFCREVHRCAARRGAHGAHAPRRTPHAARRARPESTHSLAARPRLVVMNVRTHRPTGGRRTGARVSHRVTAQAAAHHVTPPAAWAPRWRARAWGGVGGSGRR